MNHRIDATWCRRNAANVITVLGILLCFQIQWEIFTGASMLFIIMHAMLVMATDFLDGKTARHFEKMGVAGSISEFGEATDRIRDKLFQFTMFLFLIWHPMVHRGVKLAFALLVVAEIFLAATLFMGVKKKKSVGANKWGKLKMASGCAGILAALLIIEAESRGMKMPAYVNYILLCVLVASFGLAVMSFLRHMARYREQ